MRSIRVKRMNRKDVSCWQMTWPERFKVAITGRIWSSVPHMPGVAVAGMMLSVSNPLAGGCVHSYTQTLIDGKKVRVVCADPACRYVISTRQKV